MILESKKLNKIKIKMSFSYQFATLDEAFNPHPILTQEQQNEIEKEAEKKREEQRKEYEKKYPPPPPPTPEEVEAREKAWDEFIKDSRRTINFTTWCYNVRIGKMCYETFPCKHVCNGKLKGANTFTIYYVY